MKIDSSIVGMESARTYHSRGTSVRHEMIRDYRRNFEGGLFGGSFFESALTGEQASDESGESKKNAAAEWTAGGASFLQTWNDRYGMKTGGTWFGSSSVPVGGARMSARMDRESGRVMEDLRQITVRYIFELLFATRRGMRRKWLEEHGGLESGRGQGTLAQSGTQTDAFGANGLVVQKIFQESTYAEEEHAGFASEGRVRTADGREISFQIDLSMSRAFEMSFSREIEKVKQVMKDPLVINFDTSAVQLKEQKFFFDLDADGVKEEISMLENGSGFLALDKNEDGVIGDGSELFGTRSGDGFRDLAQYDQDGNGWIDENDDIWSKLRIWTKDEEGNDILYRLADKNLGAIYLGNVSTEFSLVGQTGKTDGMIRKTGVFLYEDGLAGTIQHVDLSTYQKEA